MKHGEDLLFAGDSDMAVTHSFQSQQQCIWPYDSSHTDTMRSMSVSDTNTIAIDRLSIGYSEY